MRAKKKAVTNSITAVAQPTTSSLAWVRYRQATAIRKTVSMSPQSRIDPASADHIPVMV